MGRCALFNNTSGSFNTAIGVGASFNNTTGSFNTAIGVNALFYNTSGSNNIAFGQNAGCFLSGSSSNNITIGFEAGPSTATDESNKLYIASGSGTPLIKGDFAAKTVDISGSLTATSFTGSLLGTASNSLTASYLNTLNQDLTFNGNLTLNGTASITYLNVSYESASVIYSSGSNQFGDASNDTQTLWGTVDVKTGPVLVTGSIIATSGFTGSLLGTATTASYVQNAQTASYVL
jgi:hypothetical protein